jgi:hypothetical protein
MQRAQARCASIALRSAVMNENRANKALKQGAQAK